MSDSPAVTPTLIEQSMLTVEQRNRLEAFRAMTSRWSAEWESLPADEQAGETSAYEKAMKAVERNPLSLRDSVTGTFE